MRGRSIKLALLTMLAGAMPVRSQAAVIWDYSPAASPGATLTGEWANSSMGQNFAERVSFAAGASVTGIDIYSAGLFGDVGSPVVIRIWNGVGVPGALLAVFPTVISIEDNDGAGAAVSPNGYGPLTRKHADISFAMLPGVSYWIGMSGDGFELGQIGLQAVDDGQMAQFSGAFFSHLADLGDQAFRLEGDVGAVPEPSSIALLTLGLTTVAMLKRQRRRLGISRPSA